MYKRACLPIQQHKQTRVEQQHFFNANYLHFGKELLFFLERFFIVCLKNNYRVWKIVQEELSSYKKNVCKSDLLWWRGEMRWLGMTRLVSRQVQRLVNLSALVWLLLGRRVGRNSPPQSRESRSIVEQVRTAESRTFPSVQEPVLRLC